MKNAASTRVSPTLAMVELFHTAPRTMSALFAVVAVAVTGGAVTGLL